MKVIKFLLLACLLYCNTSCEKSTITPDESGSKARTSAEQEVFNSTITSSTTSTVYKYYSTNGTTITLPSTKLEGSIRNKYGVYAKIPPAPSPCYPIDPRCPLGKNSITGSIDPNSKTLKLFLPNNPNTIIVTYNIIADPSFFKPYYPTNTSTYTRLY